MPTSISEFGTPSIPFQIAAGNDGNLYSTALLGLDGRNDVGRRDDAYREHGPDDRQRCGTDTPRGTNAR
ncbi:MAG: hypothetical protein K2R98_12570 [Gemmataceae bacterium]|nr:hypothetical protein [Gemmataceae bacterium]